MTRRRLLPLLLAGCSTTAAVKPAPPPVAESPPAPAASVDAILAASRLPEPLAAPLDGDPMGVTVHRLSSGLTVFISRMPAGSTVRAWTVVRAGSRNDPAASTGLAHYLEHMLFKGTSELGSRDWAAEKPHLDRIAELYARLRGVDEAGRAAVLEEIDRENQLAAAFVNPGELSQVYQRLGIRYDAFTGYDITSYVHNVPVNMLPRWAAVEARRYRDPAFREFPTEIEAVYEERNLRDTPERRVFTEEFVGLFPTHPYGTQTAIGTIEHLKNPAFNDMVAFHHAWYAPNNMALVLIGDVDPATTIPMLEQAFAGWAPRPLPDALPGSIAPLTSRVQREVVDHGAQGVVLAWLLPRGGHDPATWDVITELLGNPRGGLLARTLVLPQLLPGAYVQYQELEDATVLDVRAGLSEGQTHEAAEKLIRDAMGRIAAGDFSDELLAAVELNNRVSTAISLEDPDYRAALLAEFFSRQVPWREAVARLVARTAVTRAAVMREARALLGDAYVAVYRKDGTYVRPTVAKPKLTPTSARRGELGPMAQSVLAMPVPDVQPRWLEEGRDYVRAGTSDAPLFVARNAESGLFTVEYRFAGGRERDALRCYALDGLELVGAREKDAATVQAQLFALGATVSGRCERDEAVLEIAGVDAKLDETLALVRAWLGAPRVPPEALARRVANDLRARREAMDQKGVRQAAAFAYLTRGHDSTYLDELSNRQLTALRPRDLERALGGLLTAGHETLFFGPRPTGGLAQDLSLGPSRRPASPTPPVRWVRSAATEILLVPFPSAETRVSITLATGPLDPDVRGAARVFGTFAHAQVWEEIRQARALAYSVSVYPTLNQRAGDDGAIVASMACQTDKLPEALPALLAQLDGLSRPPETRFDAARAAADLALRADRRRPRDVPRVVHEWSHLGFASDPGPRALEVIRTSTAASLGAFAAAHVHPPYRIMLVGDPKRMDRKALEAIGPVKDVRPEDLFSYGPFPTPR